MRNQNDGGDAQAEVESLPVGEGFPRTEWTIVLSAGQALSGASAAALERLCRSCWPPIYAFLRRRGYDVHDAQDLTQGFILCLLERNSLAAVDPHKGRFHGYLLGLEFSPDRQFLGTL